MSKCSHGVHVSDGDTVARYCQLCTLGSSGGIMPSDQPTEKHKPTCPRCKGENVSFDFQTETLYCLTCQFDLKF